MIKEIDPRGILQDNTYNLRQTYTEISALSPLTNSFGPEYYPHPAAIPPCTENFGTSKSSMPMRFTKAPGTTNALRIHSFVGHAAQLTISLASDCRAGIDDRWPRL
jgi:hypothetical protein